MALEEDLLALDLSLDGVRFYQRKLAALYLQFCAKKERRVATNQEEAAIALLHFLEKWPARFDGNRGNTSLSVSIDRMLQPNHWNPIANCVGLSSLYTVLALRDGIDLSALHRQLVTTEGYIYGHAALSLPNGRVIDPSGKKIQKATEKWPAELHALDNLANEALLWVGIRKNMAGRQNEAITDFTRVLEKAKGGLFFGMAYHRRGLALWGKREYEQALDDFEKAAENNPALKFAQLFYRGREAEIKKEYETAAYFYSETLKQTPRNHRALTRLAICNLRQGNYTAYLTNRIRSIWLKVIDEADYRKQLAPHDAKTAATAIIRALNSF